MPARTAYEETRLIVSMSNVLLVMASSVDLNLSIAKCQDLRFKFAMAISWSSMSIMKWTGQQLRFIGMDSDSVARHSLMVFLMFLSVRFNMARCFAMCSLLKITGLIFGIAIQGYRNQMGFTDRWLFAALVIRLLTTIMTILKLSSLIGCTSTQSNTSRGFRVNFHWLRAFLSTAEGDCLTWVVY